jgi:N-carbamoyl-L-amino-acid hydrolase
VERPGGPDAHEVPVGVGEVVDLGPEAGARDGPSLETLALETLDLAVEVVGGELEPHGASNLAAALGVPSEHEEGLLLEHEEGAVRVLALVVGGGGAAAEETGVPVHRAVEIGHVEVNGSDEAHAGGFARLGAPSEARRFSRSFFFRWRSLRQRLIALEPLPIGEWELYKLRAVPLDPGRTVAELRELRELTGDDAGAQRVAWTDTWAQAREWLAAKLAETGAEVETDPAGNQWFTLRGGSERALLIGGHIDSVPNGGWLDGALNMMAGAEVLRRIAEEGEPPVTVRLVNWADEEGARFGRSLFGSSAASGTMDDQGELRTRTDAEGTSLPDALARHGVDLDRALDARSQLENAAAYLELHIEQGPVLESLDLPLGVVLGTFGVERHEITFRGQAAHAGSTPMDARRDALAGAAKLALEIRDIAKRTGGGAVCTMGSCVTRPGIVTSVVETCTVLLDQRHLDAEKLAAMLREAEEASEGFAREEDVEVEWERVWSIHPILFDDGLIELADDAVTEVAGASHRLPSGPLHDAAEVARAGIPAVMLFAQSLRGLSHTKLEDTRPEHIELSVQALDRLAAKALEWVAR